MESGWKERSLPQSHFLFGLHTGLNYGCVAMKLKTGIALLNTAKNVQHTPIITSEILPTIFKT